MLAKIERNQSQRLLVSPKNSQVHNTRILDSPFRGKQLQLVDGQLELQAGGNLHPL